MDKYAIITLKRKGFSNRKIEKELGINRKTVAKYWNEYVEHVKQLGVAIGDDTVKDLQEKIVHKPKYDSSNRKPAKYTKEIDTAIDHILENEQGKDYLLGNHKQKLTNIQIHEMLLEQGFDIGRSTVSQKIREKREKAKEAFIRQQYELGDRLEYDFGEVKLEISGKVSTYYIAVLGSPAGGHRWAYLYDNQKKEVFMDSHVKYFERVGGVFKEVVYDNMKNVVHRFIGRNEKELNEDLVKMSLYYGFSINTTNCYRGNEKGYVEGSVKKIRKDAFAKKYVFETLDDARAHLENTLIDLNRGSRLEEEKKVLLPYKPPLELGVLSKQRVDKYSFIRVDNNFYSVPDHLVGYKVDVKTYVDKIIVYANNIKVCEHKRIDGFGEMQVNIYHYLDTFLKKPGALKNSKALKCMGHIKTIYDTHFTTRTKQFIELLKENENTSAQNLIPILEKAAKDTSAYRTSTDEPIKDNINNKALEQIQAISRLYLKGGEKYVN